MSHRLTPVLLVVALAILAAAGCSTDAAGRSTGAPSSAGATSSTRPAPGPGSTTTTVAGTPRTATLPEVGTEYTVPPPLKLKGEQVALFGDSLTDGIKAEFPKVADAYGFKVRIDAVVGRNIEDGLKALKTMVAKGGDALVVALGTNDARRTFDEAEYRKRIEDVFAIVGDTMPVLWVNVYRDADTQAGDDAARFNSELDAATLRHPNLTVLDWASYVQAHKSVMADDRIHLTTEGYTARAAWLGRLIADHLSASGG